MTLPAGHDEGADRPRREGGHPPVLPHAVVVEEAPLARLIAGYPEREEFQATVCGAARRRLGWPVSRTPR